MGSVGAKLQLPGRTAGALAPLPGLCRMEHGCRAGSSLLQGWAGGAARLELPGSSLDVPPLSVGPGDIGCVHLLAGQRHPAAPGPSLWVTSSQGIPSSLEPCLQVDLGRTQGGEVAPAAGTCPWEEWVLLWGRGGGSGTASWVSPWPRVRPPQPRGRGAARMGNNAPLLTASSIVPENPF